MIDPNSIRRVVRLAGIDSGDRVIEVGAGLGTLTMALSEAASQVVAVELDRKLVPALQRVTGGLPNVTVVQADALGLDWAGLLAGRPHRLVSNLPYNIATPLVATLLAEVPAIFDITAVVQREAGERFAAPPGSKTYGGISVLVAYYCAIKAMGKVPPTVFWPQPSVDSVVVRMSRHPPPVEVNPEKLMKVVRAAFSQRRKTIRNSLPAALGLDLAEVQDLLRRSGVDSSRRAESLTLEEFARIANEMIS